MEDQRELVGQPSITKPIHTGIRVLAVDDDAACLHIVEVILQALRYDVVSVTCASDALALLRERQGGFDIVLTDLHMPEMDGIVLLKHVLVEFKIPVVMMSVDDKDVMAIRCLEGGASFYFKKPLTKSDLSNLWQYVYLKRYNGGMLMEKITSDSELPRPKVVSSGDNTEFVASVNGGSSSEESREKASEKKNQNEGENSEDSGTRSMSRIVWNSVLHKKFLDAINQIGLNRAVPTKILEKMNIPGLTREHVSSHLQKYRLFLRRITEASRSREPTVARSLKRAIYKSRFASGLPSPLLEQSCAYKVNQRTQTCVQPAGDDGFSHLQRRTQIKLRDLPLLDMISSGNKRNCDSTLASKTNKLAMIQPKSDTRTNNFACGSLDYSFTTRFSGENIQNVSFGNGLAGIEVNNSTKLSGFNQMPIVHGATNGISSGYSKRDEIRNGKRPLVDTVKSPPPLPRFASSHSGYASEGLAFSAGLLPQGLASPTESISVSKVASANPFSSILTNVHQKLPMFSLPSPQQNEVEVQAVNSFQNSSSFDEGYLCDSLFMPGDQSSGQQNICEEMDSDVNINSYNVENDNPPRQISSSPPLQQQNQIEVGEIYSLLELTKNNSFDDQDFLSDILSMPQDICGEVMDHDFNINSYHVDNNNQRGYP